MALGGSYFKEVKKKNAVIPSTRQVFFFVKTV